MADRQGDPRRGRATGAGGLSGQGDHRKRTADQRLDQGRAEVLADLALDRGVPIIDGRLGVVAVPDVVIAQGFANGLPTPASVRLERADGRTVALYRWPLPAREVAR